MATIDFLRDRLIDKLMTIDDRELLEALDQLLRSKTNPDDKVKITEAQHRMLQLSEDDIKYGRTISQEQMDKEDLDWLDEAKYGRKQPESSAERCFVTGKRTITPPRSAWPN